MKKITCRNQTGQEVVFTYDFTPFHLLSVDGIYRVTNNVYMTENTMIDGSTYQGSVIKQRDIVIAAEMMSDYQRNRDLLYQIFKPKAYGIFLYEEEDRKREINYIVEDLDIEEKGVVRGITISLRCPEPYFKELHDIEINMTSWVNRFQWPHEFLTAGEEFAVKEKEQIKEVDTQSAADYIGITVIITSDGEVVNPSFYHFESDETMKVLTTLQAGQKLIITTQTNNKNVRLNKNGKEEEVNHLIDEDSEFIQLYNGTNTLQYDAESGAQYMNVMIMYRRRYLGA